MRGLLRTLGVIGAVALLGDLCFAQEAVEASAVLTDDLERDLSPQRARSRSY